MAHRVLRELDNIYAACSMQNWDGYDAFPVCKNTYLKARKFLNILSWIPFLPMPEVCPSTDGSIDLCYFPDFDRIWFIVSEKNIEFIGNFRINRIAFKI